MELEHNSVAGAPKQREQTAREKLSPRFEEWTVPAGEYGMVFLNNCVIHLIEDDYILFDSGDNSCPPPGSQPRNSYQCSLQCAVARRSHAQTGFGLTAPYSRSKKVRLTGQIESDGHENESQFRSFLSTS
jgi:hypothetical protein